MKAGRELDVLIAEKVMGWKECSVEGWRTKVAYGKPPHFEDYDPRVRIEEYSTNISDAWKVVEKLQADGYMYSISSILANGKFTTQVEFARNTDFDLKWYKKTTKTAPLAICLASLKVKGIDTNENNKH